MPWLLAARKKKLLRPLRLLPLLRHRLRPLLLTQPSLLTLQLLLLPLPLTLLSRLKALLLQAQPLVLLPAPLQVQLLTLLKTLLARLLTPPKTQLLKQQKARSNSSPDVVGPGFWVFSAKSRSQDRLFYCSRGLASKL